MTFGSRDIWALIHGIGFGALFLLAFAGGLADLYSLRRPLLTELGVVEKTRRLVFGVTAMAVVDIGAVVTGTWIVYPWYREKTPDSPRTKILADATTADWHTFGMEWKEHVAWISPMLAVAAAFIALYYGRQLVSHNRVRHTVTSLFIGAFVFALIAGVLGALITKVASV
jgi:hypothetical protein